VPCSAGVWRPPQALLSTSDDDFDMLLAIPYPSHVPRSPPIVRSDDWIARVIDVLLLRGQEFVRNFRMTRESFDRLHAISK
jgi:hypothetical protein